MLYYDRTDVSEEVGVHKASRSEECDICHCSYFLNGGFSLQPNVWNESHDLLMMFMNISNIASLNIKGNHYRCGISGISKIGVINLMQNIDLTKKSRTLHLSLSLHCIF